MHSIEFQMQTKIVKYTVIVLREYMTAEIADDFQMHLSRDHITEEQMYNAFQMSAHLSEAARGDINSRH